MAGTDSRFDPAAFKAAVRFAMTMGLPEDSAERATFQWDPVRTFTSADASGNPFDWTDTPDTSLTFVDVQIPVAVEFVSRGGDTQDTRVGQMDVSRAILTILDDDYALLTQNGRFANQVLLGDAIYRVEFTAPATGLFDVTVYSVHIQAIDES